MRESEPKREHAAVRELRKSILERLLLLCMLLLSSVMLLSFRKPFLFERKIFAIAILPGWLLVAIAALWPRAPQAFRRLTLILGVLTISFGSVAKLGFQATNSFCAHLMLLVMVSLMMGKRAAWTVWAIGMIGWIAIGTAWSLSGTAGGETLYDPSMGSNWARVIGIYGLLSVTTLLVVSYVVERLEGALERSAALYDALTAESTRRLAALEEQRALEERLRQSHKLEALGTLAGGVAHDFNNLLVVIINHAELAALRADSESVRKSLTQIQAAGERAAGLTRKLLAFGRRQVAQRATIDLHARIEDSLGLLQRLLPTSIELSYELGADPPNVWAAEIELDQIIMNLCVNARDAMPEGGKLAIRTRRSERTAPGQAASASFVCIEIEDSGTGMDDATRARMFEPFFTTKSPGHGTGLGLSTVHGLVQQAGGFIEVDSAPGRGTRVNVYLPVHEGEATSKSAAARWSGRRGNETLLVVDDDPEVLAVLKSRLEDNGYRVIACRDGEEALREYRRSASDIALVISDAVMPKLGGRELHRAISAEFGEIPFLICSGYAAQTLEPEFFDHPLRAFLPKPFDDRALQESVRALLDEAKNARKEGHPGAAFAAAAMKTLTH
jgi:signal transduction histidine kinase/CheY-like chemotaxis protein